MKIIFIAILVGILGCSKATDSSETASKKALLSKITMGSHIVTQQVNSAEVIMIKDLRDKIPCSYYFPICDLDKHKDKYQFLSQFDFKPGTPYSINEDGSIESAGEVVGKLIATQKQ